MKKTVIILSILLVLSVTANICFLLFMSPCAGIAPDKTQAVKQDLSKISETDLFPLYGIVLGKTTVEELSALGVKSSRFNYYDVHGFNFWYSKDGNKADHISITHWDALPEKWRNFGMDWGLSYQQWLNLFKKQGFEINIIETPKNVSYRGRDSFRAGIQASRKGENPVIVRLDFRYSKSTKEDDAGTLYSITVRSW